ncbi:MAG: transporter, partial [Gemmatimonadetes bacterium]
MHASATPVSLPPTSERIEALDTLRGVAVFGILLANVLVFFGLFMLPSDRAAALPTARADAVVAFVEKVLVDGKFYSIFSLLFGIGFGLQLARGGETAVPRFNRRLRILLAIGAIHAFLIWAGDILMLYALLGFTLPWFARKTSRELLR